MLEKLFRVAVDRAVPFEIPRAHLGVGVDRSFVEALELNDAGGVDALADFGGRFAGVFAGQLLIAQGWHFDLDVNAVEQRAGDFGAVALDLQRRAGAFLLRVGEIAAGTLMRCLFVIGPNPAGRLKISNILKNSIR